MQGHDNLQHDNYCRTIAEAAYKNVVVHGHATRAVCVCVCVCDAHPVFCERAIGRSHVMALASSKNCPATATLAFSFV